MATETQIRQKAVLAVVVDFIIITLVAVVVVATLEEREEEIITRQHTRAVAVDHTIQEAISKTLRELTRDMEKL